VTAVTLLLRAAIAGGPYPPPGVEDTPANRELWGEIGADLAALPAGVIPDVPFDWTEMPDVGGPGPAVQAGGGFSPGEARDGHGRWSGHEGAGMIRRTAKGRLAAQTPSRFTHPGTGHAMGKTEIGDTYEALFQAKGARLLEQRFGGPYRVISGGAKEGGGRGARNTPLDFALDHSHAGELKTLNVRAKSQKTAIKADEVARKETAARQQGMAPLLVVQVVDPDAGQVKVYAYPAFASKTTTAMESLGSYSYTPGDFQAAQEATGHWAQRDARAAKQAAQGTVSAAGAPADPDALPVDPDAAPGDTVIELRDGVPYISTHPGGHAPGGPAASGDDSDGEGPYVNVTARFDPGEKRDPDGKWVAGAVKALDVRQRVGFKGHDIDRTKGKGYRVRLKSGEVRHYERPEHAAQAALLGAHFTPGEPEPARSRAKPGKITPKSGGPQAAKPPAPARIHATLARPAGTDVKKDIAPLFDGEYGGGFTVRTDSAAIVKAAGGGKNAEVSASIYHDGKKVGIVVRGLRDGPDGTHVHNVEMLLSPKYQGHGFASEFTRQTESRLKAAGVQHASLRANQDVGGYAWARKGFDWAKPRDGQDKVGELASWYKDHGRQDPAVTKEIRGLVSRAKDPASPHFPTPYDLSRVGYTPGAATWPGKEFLLGRGWDGVKKL
jgi:GNAT superfamily N-acetyltransferase